MAARTVSLASSVVPLVTIAGLAGLAGLAGCGGHNASKPTTPGGATTGGTGGSTGIAPGGPVTAARVCDRIFELQDQGCDLVAGYSLSRDECEADYTRSLEERGDAARAATERAGHCLIDQASCQAITDCMNAMSSGANNGEPEDFRSCSQTDVYAPVGVSQADFDRRKGALVDRFSDADSTKEAPIEVCGIPNEMTWLLAAKCNDGSNPFEDFDHAHAARVGNVGEGGRCGSIVDLYEVPCPEGTYSIYIDAYVCPVPPGAPVPQD